MLKIYKTSAVEKKTKKVKKMTADCWIDLIVPTTDEIDKVVNRTGYRRATKSRTRRQCYSNRHRYSSFRGKRRT